MKIRTEKRDGYQYIYDPSHPLANKSGKAYYHRIVASEKLGRWLKPNEVVHHIDGNTSNNHPDNLVVITSSEHARFHRTGDYEKHEPVSCENCGEETYNKRFCSYKCSNEASRKVEWPSVIQLRDDIETLSWTAIGRKYGVSDNAVRKWARKYGLL